MSFKNIRPYPISRPVDGFPEMVLSVEQTEDTIGVTIRPGADHRKYHRDENSPSPYLHFS